jgi:hypothetical protein
VGNASLKFTQFTTNMLIKQGLPSSEPEEPDHSSLPKKSGGGRQKDASTLFHAFESSLLSPFAFLMSARGFCNEYLMREWSLSPANLLP